MNSLQTLLTRFNRSRRGAVAVIFALTLVPLVLLIALTIDFSFFTEARSQIQLAADAAATHAVRAATGTYSLETTDGVAVATAQSDAIAAGETAGADWFQSQLGQLPTGYVPAAANGKADPYVLVTATTNPSGFTASVNYDGIYPPFFNHLFAATQNWNVAGTSGASTQYSYVEILMMLDTSNSMLLGANPQDIQTMSTNTVCMTPAAVQAGIVNSPAGMTQGGDFPLIEDIGNNGGTGDKTYEYNAADGNQVDFKTAGVVAHWTPGSSADGTNGTCKTGYQIAGFNSGANAGDGFQGAYGYAGAPCALACHVTATKYTNGNFEDLYGWDRNLKNPDGTAVTLRLDVVLQATETVIQSMINTEQAGDQFSVGLYQFNTALNNWNSSDVAVLASGTQGTTGDSSGDISPEATYNLPGALQAVYGIDYTHAPEDTFPPVYAPPSGDYETGDTDFPTAVTNLIGGTATSGTPLAAVTQATAGYTASNPLKDIFIVTDGMEDTCGYCGSARVMGEMTSVAAENGTSQQYAPVCKKLKNLGFTVYVLYVTYYPPPTISFYYQPFGSPTDNYTNADYPSINDGTERQMTQPASTTGVTPINSQYPGDSPNESALRACASTTGGQPDFFIANNAADIATAMSAMLKSALSSAIRLTH
jgi:Flp pilus assembly protein TadG